MARETSMDFQFTPEEAAFREELRIFLKEALPPDWRGPRIDEHGEEAWDCREADRIASSWTTASSAR